MALTNDTQSASFLVHGGSVTLVDQIVAWVVARIDERVYRIGARLPSIRDFAQRHQISRFTVVEAYDRLIARGYLESRRGSGFYVSKRTLSANEAHTMAPWAWAQQTDIDVVWLIRNLFRQLPHEAMPGAGTLPPDWLDSDLLGNSLRAMSRANARGFLDYGAPQGYLPLREQLTIRLAEMELLASPEQILTTAGVTQGLDLVAQHCVKPGETIFVDDPAWYLMFGRFARLGAQVVGVPRLDDGPDIEALRRLAAVHGPKLFVTSSILHNPTGSNTSAAKAHRILQLAAQFNFLIAEDDIYGDFQPTSSSKSLTRLATLDQWQRVIYLSSFSKTLAANLRVGYMVACPELIRQLTDLKMLVGLTTSELGERLVFRVLSEGHYRKHVERLRERLQRAREPAIRALERIGLRLPASQASGAGMFLWADAGVDTLSVAQKMAEQDYLVAPGSLFLPDQGPSTWMRFNIATCHNPASLAALERSLARVSGLP
jgi:DNA-binding transcriptional MocR family regulator